MVKKIFALFLSIITVLSLCSCESASPVSEDTGKVPVILNVITSYGSEDGNRRNFEYAVAAYENSTGNKVKDGSDTSNEEWKAKVLTDFETGSEPDVLFFFTNADAEPFIKAGKVASLDEIRTVYPEYATNMKSSMLPLASDGKCYAIPVMGYWENLFVNKAVLKACGISVPGKDYSWDQFLSDCEIIKSKGYTPIACSLAEVSHYWFEYAVLNNGSIDDHLNIPKLDENGNLVEDATAEKWIAALEDIKMLYELGYFPENTLTARDAETVAMFGDGKAAFLLDGSWKVGYFSEYYADCLDDFTVCFVPSKGNRKTTEIIAGISAGYFITRKAWDDPLKREAAVEFVSQLTSNEVIKKFVTTEITALKEEIVPQGLNSLQQSAAEIRNSTTAIVGAVQDTISNEARSSLFANIQNVVTGNMSSHDAVEIAMRLNK